MNKSVFTYKKSGVDIKAADKFINFISNITTKKGGRKKLNNIGGFGSINKIPKNIKVPIFTTYKDTSHTKDVKRIINEYFPDNYGKTEDFNYPTTRTSALAMVDQFISEKLNNFGDYEDSVDSRSPFWFHSVLSPLLNIGLIVPNDIISRVL